MGPVQMVMFDLAGTTVDDGGAVLHCLLDAASAHDLPGSSDELNDLMGLDKLEVFRMLAGRRYPDDRPRAEEVAAQALQGFIECMRASYERALQPIPGAEQTFTFLRSRGIKVATDTGFDSTIAGMIMDGLGWAGRYVDTCVCSSDVPRGRPAPYMIFTAMERLGVIDVRQVIKVGDAPADLQEGANAGCGEVIGVLSGAHTATTLGRYPHTRMLASVADLPALFAE